MLLRVLGAVSHAALAPWRWGGRANHQEDGSASSEHPLAVPPPDVVSLLLAIEPGLAPSLRLVCKEWCAITSQRAPCLKLKPGQGAPPPELLPLFPAAHAVSCAPAPPSLGAQAPLAVVDVIDQLSASQPLLTSLDVGVHAEQAPTVLNHLGMLPRLSQLTVTVLPSLQQAAARVSTGGQQGAAAAVPAPWALDAEGALAVAAEAVAEVQPDRDSQRLQLDALQALPKLQSLQVINATPEYEHLRALTGVTSLKLKRKPKLIKLDLKDLMTLHPTLPTPTSPNQHAADALSPSSSPQQHHHQQGPASSASSSGASPAAFTASPASSSSATPGSVATPAARGAAAPVPSSIEGPKNAAATEPQGVASPAAADVNDEEEEEEEEGGAAATPAPSSCRPSSSGVAIIAARPPAHASPGARGGQGGGAEASTVTLEAGRAGISLEGVEQLVQLTHLSVPRSTHAWQLPEGLTQLTRLKELDVGQNVLASLPANLGALTGIVRLDITACCLQALPESFARLSRLEHLAASGNPGLRFPLACATSLTALTHLDLSWSEGNNIGEVFALSPASFGRLRALNLRGNGLTALLPSFPTLSSLTSLNLSGNPFDAGALPQEVLALRQLRHLDVSMCQLEALPDELAPALGGALTRLDAGINLLTRLPRNLGKLTRLQHLDVSANMLTSLPPGVPKAMRGLKVFKTTANLLPEEGASAIGDRSSAPEIAAVASDEE